MIPIRVTAIVGGSSPYTAADAPAREGLLPAGQPTAATQAQYSDEHVARLGLIRALLGVGGLSVAAAREVLAAVDDPTMSAHDMIGAAHGALPPGSADGRPDLGTALAHVRRWGWQVHDDTPAMILLAQALAALEAAGFDTPDSMLDRYAWAAHELGEQDVAEVPMDSPTEAVRFVVIGTLLMEPVLLALRRLAHEDVSARRLSD